LMPSRREFIQQVASTSVLAITPPILRLALAGSRGPRFHRPFKVTFDRTLPGAPAFGAEAERQGASVLTFQGDPGGVWMNAIEPRWKGGRAAVAGLTTLPALFSLELLGRDYGMGLSYCAEHRPSADGFVHRVLIGRDQMTRWRNSLNQVDQSWSEVAATAVMNSPQDLAPDPRMSLLDLTASSIASEVTLYSWVISPAQRPGVLGGRWIHENSRRG
jgi:hypothetical protein